MGCLRNHNETTISFHTGHQEASDDRDMRYALMRQKKRKWLLLGSSSCHSQQGLHNLPHAGDTQLYGSNSSLVRSGPIFDVLLKSK
ncbi:hypothetical protein Y1Q_0024370 [Alligator mississippiensis]|uniref:Uncharacterized protein n=1 Tax=Alligator mississippiensis TaxID=8496 RepID=A0A151NIR4_ALLMI|nr:hypothetical protein Y1Q_0024370 [Alligator mississippiensis]